MGRAIEGVNWEEIQLAYQKGENCREIGERLGISIKAISQRCTKEGWRKEQKQIGELVSKITLETLAARKVKQIEEIQNEAIPIARLIQTECKKTIASMNGQELEPSELNGLAQALKTANHTALLNAGWVQQTAVDVTSGGLSMHESAISILNQCRKAVSDGFDTKTLDVDGMTKKLEESRDSKE